MPGGSDRRRYERQTVNREFESIDAFVTEYVTDISGGGIYIRSKDPLPLGTLVSLRFTLLLDEIETIEGVGEVVRVEAAGLDAGMGVRFKDLTPLSREIVQRITAAHVRGAPPGRRTKP